MIAVIVVICVTSALVAREQAATGKPGLWERVYVPAGHRIASAARAFGRR